MNRNFADGLLDIQVTFKKYTKRELPRFYVNLKQLAFDQSGRKSLD